MVINMINEGTTLFNEVGVIVKDIIELRSLSPNSIFSQVSRTRNNVTHIMTKWFLINDGEFIWLEEAPSWLSDFVFKLEFFFKKKFFF